MDKEISKKIFIKNKILTPKYFIFTFNKTNKELISLVKKKLNFPVVIKPINEGSSVNVYICTKNNLSRKIKLLKDYPEWDFLSNDDLNRKTIEIFFDLKIAKRLCNKEQKVIKVPNTDVFKMVAPILLSRGISRIVSNDKLIAL